jgi:hypothetical protein
MEVEMSVANTVVESEKVAPIKGINSEYQKTVWLRDLFCVVVDNFVRLTAENEELREHVRRLAQGVLEATATPRHGVSATDNAEIAITTITDTFVAIADAAVGASDRDSAPVALELPMPVLTLGQKSRTTEPSISLPQRWSAKVEDDLALIKARSELKAKAVRWAAIRSRRMAEGDVFSTEIAPGDREIIDDAKRLPNCFLWMSRPNAPAARDPRLSVNVAGCFDAVANVLGILMELQFEPGVNQPEFEQALDLLAEAQSALRVGILTMSRMRPITGGPSSRP